MYGKSFWNRNRHLQDHCSRFISLFDGIAMTNVISEKQISQTDFENVNKIHCLWSETSVRRNFKANISYYSPRSVNPWFYTCLFQICTLLSTALSAWWRAFRVLEVLTAIKGDSSVATEYRVTCMGVVCLAALFRSGVSGQSIWLQFLIKD